MLPDGRVVFGSSFNFNLVNDGIFVWRDGTIDWQIRLPLQFGNSTITGNPNAFSINSRGDWVALMGNTGIYMMRGSTVQKVMTAAETPPNLAMTPSSIPVVDESGRVSFELFSGSDTSSFSGTARPRTSFCIPVKSCRTAATCGRSVTICWLLERRW